MLATPLRCDDVAVGEMAWALLRGRGLLRRVPRHDGRARAGDVVVGVARGARRRCSSASRSPAPGMAATTFMRSFVDFDYVNLGADPAVPVLGDVLPALAVPDAAAVGRAGHAAVPGRRPRAGPRVRRPQLDAPPQRRISRGHGPGGRPRRRSPPGPAPPALTCGPGQSAQSLPIGTIPPVSVPPSRSGGRTGGERLAVAPSSASPHHDRLAYMPALDGVRAMAVAAVLLYHGDVSWARGGYLGVDAFFVLSGFLITSLLLAEWRRRRPDRVVGVLGPARPAAAPALVLVARRRRRSTPVIVGAGRSSSHSCAATACPTLGYVANWRPDLLAPVVLRAVRGAVAAASTPGRWRSKSSSTWCGRCSSSGVLRWRRGSIRSLGAVTRRTAGGVGGVDDRAFTSRASTRPRLLRDRHTRAVVADGRAARDAVDAVAPAAGCDARPRAPLRRVGGRPLAGVDLGAHV